MKNNNISNSRRLATFLSIALLGSIALSGCMKEPVSTEKSSNSQINVELMFEKDGVKVYRFEDGGRAIYYTDARGRIEWTTTTNTGKTAITHRHAVETVE